MPLVQATLDIARRAGCLPECFLRRAEQQQVILGGVVGFIAFVSVQNLHRRYDMCQHIIQRLLWFAFE